MLSNSSFGIVGFLLVLPSIGSAQDTLAAQLPVPRLLQSPPTVPDVGQFSTVKGGTLGIPLSTTLGVADLREQDKHLNTLFPMSAAYHPADSLRGLKAARAGEWRSHLIRTNSARTLGRYSLDLAEIEARAGNDSAAKRLVDAEVRASPAGKAGVQRRTVALGVGVGLFTTESYDSARIARNYPIAEAYATQITAAPLTGWTTTSDSTDILYRQLNATFALVRAADIIGDNRNVLTYSARLLDIVDQLGLGERRELLMRRYPYREVARALAAQDGGRAKLDAINTRMLKVGAARGNEDAALEPQRRTQAYQQVTRFMQERFASVQMLGKPAPAIAAHAWLNTPDSTYQDSARTRDFTDGVVRVLAFSVPEDSVSPALQHIQDQVGSKVQVVMHTQTRGHAGFDILTPPAEVEWLKTFYRTKRHFTIPISLWAGPKQGGAHGSRSPRPSPAYRAYHVNALFGAVVLIDGKGVIRAFEPLAKRDDEARIIRRVNALVAEGGAQ